MLVQKVQQLEEENAIELSSEAALQAQKRRIVIRIGELETDLERVEEQLLTARKKEKPQLEVEQQSLEKQLVLLEKQLEMVNTNLANREGERIHLFEENALDQAVSFNEEREVSASENYQKYYDVAVDALTIENEITILNKSLSEKRALVTGMIASGISSEDEAIRMEIRAIQSMETKRSQLIVQLEKQKEIADAALPANDDEAMKIQNLLARGVRPVKSAAIAAALVQLPASGLAITPDASTSTYSEERPIPVGVESPSGLIYRVQVGAFGRPIPQDLFKEFNPVSGEKIPKHKYYPIHGWVLQQQQYRSRCA